MDEFVEYPVVKAFWKLLREGGNLKQKEKEVKDGSGECEEMGGSGHLIAEGPAGQVKNTYNELVMTVKERVRKSIISVDMKLNGWEKKVYRWNPAWLRVEGACGECTRAIRPSERDGEIFKMF
ncbi:hypothetical protein TWF694_003532 [Orbilia ellipsospora]|uniref:Uncharacterized protein n=1 Tax=Orbilia ellipsospora TaxID=2528407 RepID=A0AAV9WYT1_9PEZI